MKIIRARYLGMCFGVRDAITMAHRQATAQPLTVFGELVHNETVLAELSRKGVRIENDPGSIRTRSVMITAHGVSEKARHDLRERGLDVLEATCPLVHFAHTTVARLAAEGFHPVIVGKRAHVEVRGLTGDLQEFDVVLTEEDVWRLRERKRFGVAAQTTQPIERVQELVELMRRRFPDSEVRFIDTVCQPTKQRQAAARDLARQCDVVIVIGGANSNNTRELVESCSRDCPRVHHVRTAADMRPEWFEGVRVAGITAGTSTPDPVIDAVEARMRQWGAVEQLALSAAHA
jgi:4-hydroxy-3-methylbut-2-en-1-yl diphosphate reductase